MLRVCSHLKELDFSGNNLKTFEVAAEQPEHISSSTKASASSTTRGGGGGSGVGARGDFGLPLSRSLAVLRLDDNNFPAQISKKSWQTLSRKYLPALEMVSLNGNSKLANVDVSALRAVGDTDYCNASSLYLSDTGLAAWATVDVELGDPFFRNVKSLTCRRWPLFDVAAAAAAASSGSGSGGASAASSTASDMEAQSTAKPTAVSATGRPDLDRRDMLIARLPRAIATLNGSAISAEERAEAEKYCIRVFDAALTLAAKGAVTPDGTAVAPPPPALQAFSMAAQMRYQVLLARHGACPPLVHATAEDATEDGGGGGGGRGSQGIGGAAAFAIA